LRWPFLCAEADGIRVIEYWSGEVVSRDNCRVGQISLFTVAQTVSMRDSTKRRNYSAEAERFRREQAGRRAWGLTQRHARKMRRLHGSVAAAWESYHDRADEVPSAASSVRACEAGPPTPVTPTPVTPEPVTPEPATPGRVGIEPVGSEPACSAVVASAQVECVPIVSNITASEPILAEPILAEPILAEPILAEAASSARVVLGPLAGSAPPPVWWAPAALRTTRLLHRNCVARRSRPGHVGRRPAGGRIRCHRPVECPSRSFGDGARAGEDRSPRTASTSVRQCRREKYGSWVDAIFRQRRELSLGLGAVGCANSGTAVGMAFLVRKGALTSASGSRLIAAVSRYSR
jgi:hypothetical protein